MFQVIDDNHTEKWVGPLFVIKGKPADIMAQLHQMEANFDEYTTVEDVTNLLSELIVDGTFIEHDADIQAAWLLGNLV